jgi:hypothetical protein
MGTDRWKKFSLIVVVIAVPCLIGFFGHTQPDDAQAVAYTQYGSTFDLRGDIYDCKLVRSNVLSTAAWSPGKPLPLSPGRAVAIARAELKKLGEVDAAWYVKEVGLSCVGPGALESWYYNVQFWRTNYVVPISTSGYLESVIICVDFAGNPGKVSKRLPGNDASPPAHHGTNL